MPYFYLNREMHMLMWLMRQAFQLVEVGSQPGCRALREVRFAFDWMTNHDSYLMFVLGF